LRLLQRASREKGRTIVMVTHDQNAAAHGDRVIVLRDGEVVEERAVH
jgi:putative ABC transport system ATP-binding protein